MSVGGCSDFGQGAELVGFGLLLSTSFVERNFLLEEGFPSEDGNRFCHVIFFLRLQGICFGKSLLVQRCTE